MEYHVKHIVTGEERMISHYEVNDMDYDSDGGIVVFDIKMEAYLLIDDEI